MGKIRKDFVWRIALFSLRGQSWPGAAGSRLAGLVWSDLGKFGLRTSLTFGSFLIFDFLDFPVFEFWCFFQMLLFVVIVNFRILRICKQFPKGSPLQPLTCFTSAEAKSNRCMLLFLQRLWKCACGKNVTDYRFQESTPSFQVEITSAGVSRAGARTWFHFTGHGDMHPKQIMSTGNHIHQNCIIGPGHKPL